MMIQAVFIVAFVFGQAATLLFPGAKWSFLDICASVIAGMTLVKLVRARSKKRVGGIWQWVLIFSGIGLMEAAFRGIIAHQFISIAEALYIFRWAVYALFYAYVLLDSKRGQIDWRAILYISGVTLALFGIFQWLWYPDLRNLLYLGWDPHYKRVFSSLFDPNFAGAIFVLTFIAGMWAWTTYTSKRAVILPAQLITGVALLGTYSRSSYIAFIVGIIVWCVYRKAYVALFSIVVIFIAALFLLPGGMEGQNLFRTTSSLARLGSVRSAVRQFSHSPVIGTGFVNGYTQQSVPKRAGSIDTSMLFVLASTGVIGMIGYLALSFRILHVAKMGLKMKSSTPLLISSLAALFVHSMFINSLFYPWTVAWIWVLIGAVKRDITADR